MSLPKSQVAIIGLGYIGLPTAAVLASAGHQVIGVDINPAIVDTVNRGEIHVVEPDLDGLVRGAVLSGRLRAVLAPQAADTFVIAVPTPCTHLHEPDLGYIQAAAQAIAPHLRPGNLVILESTSPVGTTERLAHWLASARPDLTFPLKGTSNPAVCIAYCPERVLPGSIVTELVKNDRVIGGLTPQCAAQARSFYQSFVRGQCVITDARTAEMTKLTENTFRDVNIALANELSVICKELGVDVWELIALANRHPRVRILNPGPGVGGHCIAVDPWFIVHSAPAAARLIRTAREINDHKPIWVVRQVEAAIARYCETSGAAASEVTVGCLGLSFKADIDDLRESPALDIVAQLVHHNPTVRLQVVEPHIEELPDTLQPLPNVQLTDVHTAISEAQILVLLVDHQPFKTLDRSNWANKILIDTRGTWR